MAAGAFGLIAGRGPFKVAHNAKLCAPTANMLRRNSRGSWDRWLASPVCPASLRHSDDRTGTIALRRVLSLVAHNAFAVRFLSQGDPYDLSKSISKARVDAISEVTAQGVNGLREFSHSSIQRLPAGQEQPRPSRRTR